MQKLSLLLLLLFTTIFGNAQEIGSAGRWLKNENRRDVAIEHELNKNHAYRWEMNYDAGYAEVFIRIPEMGRFTISLGEQEISSSTGMFRFFDVYAKNQELNIWYGRRLIYRVTIAPRNNTRLVLDFFSQRGLFLLEEIDLTNVQEVYYGRRWNDVWNNAYGMRNIMNNNSFHSFFKMFEDQSFDDDKLKFFRMQKNTTSFTSKQIADMMECLSFDSNKLTLAKEAFYNVVDPENYYKLHKNFSFRSTANELTDFLTQQNNNRR